MTGNFAYNTFWTSFKSIVKYSRTNNSWGYRKLTRKQKNLTAFDGRGKLLRRLVAGIVAKAVIVGVILVVGVGRGYRAPQIL